MFSSASRVAGGWDEGNSGNENSMAFVPTPTLRLRNIGAADDTADASQAGATVGDEVRDIVDSLTAALPRIAIAVLVVIVALVLAKLVRRFLAPVLTRRRTPSFGRVISKLIAWSIVIAGILIGVTAVFPSVQPVDLLGGLGIFSIAIGFAFQDILSNLLAGVLLLIRQPFETGDQIEVQGERGTVRGITIRETQIETFDGEKLIIPNAEVYQNVIRVQTAYGPSRQTIEIGLEDWEDFDTATEVIRDALHRVDGVKNDPAPEIYFHEFGDYSTNLEVRFWTDPRQAEKRRVLDLLIRAIARNLHEADIAMPAPITEIDARDSVSTLLGMQATTRSETTHHTPTTGVST